MTYLQNILPGRITVHAEPFVLEPQRALWSATAVYASACCDWTPGTCRSEADLTYAKALPNC